MYIQDNEIKKIVNNEKEYRYARFLNIKELLERMTVSTDENNKCYRINARLSEGQKKIIIAMKISFSGEVIQYHCSCEHETIRSACRHCGSILFFLKKLDIQNFPYFYEKNTEEDKLAKYRLLEEQRQERILHKKQNESLQMIELYKDRLLRESMIPLSSQQYQLKVFVIKEKDYLLITLKIIHLTQAYIVRNIEAFLHAITHHENMKYGKNFEFIHSYDAFDDDSLEILSFIEKCFMKNKILQKGIIKTLIIDETMIDEFYNLMNSLPSIYCDISFDVKKYQIPLDITFKEESYVLDFKEYQEFEDILMSSCYIYTFNNDILYRYCFDENGQCLIFIQKLLKSQGGFYIPQNAIYDFYKYVLIDLLDYIQLDTHLFDEYHQENVINLYADMTTQDQIYIQLEYIYDDYIAYGFDKNNLHISKEVDLIENYLKPYIEDQDEHILYLLYDYDFTYSFIKEGLPYLSNYCQVYISDSLKNLSTTQQMKVQVGVHLSHHLLEINIDSININKDELYDILKAYKKKRKFYKLKNGQLLSLQNKELKELEELTSSLQLNAQDFYQDTLSIPTYRLFEIENLADKQSHLSYSRSEAFQSFVDGFENPPSFQVPSIYQNILREYQIQGYEWLRLMEYYGFSGILADDMGLGKTLQIIVYLESMKEFNMPSLVITPASLLLNWQDEIMKFSAHLNVKCIYGQKLQRDEQIQNISLFDVIITSYDYLRRDIDLYEKINFHTVILDEAQYIKNPKTRNAISVKRLKSKQRFALTGTPIENSLAEMWSLFDFLMPHYLYHYSYFLEHYERPIVKEHDEEKQARLKQMITPFILRRNKKDVLKELPAKIEKTMYFHFNEEEEKLYLSSLVQVNKTLQEKLNLNQLGRIDVLAMLTRLRQLCQEPRLLYENISKPSSKLKGCMELIHSLKDNNQKILLFSSFTSVLHLIEEQCQKEHVSYYLLDGSIPKEKRKEMVDAFQTNQTTLFLISLKAGGSGLNLTAAQAVIHYDPWWNMSAKNQATDRAHRIGQSETVQVFSLIMKNSIEEKIMKLQNQKKNLADTFVEENHGSISTMSIEDIQSLFLIDNK